MAIESEINRVELYIWRRLARERVMINFAKGKNMRNLWTSANIETLSIICFSGFFRAHVLIFTTHESHTLRRRTFIIQR